MRVTPKSEDEVSGCLQPGVYQAVVESAIEKTSQRGNEMIELQLKIYSGDDEIVLKDWLLDAVAQKVRHFCMASGLMIAYEQGALTAKDCTDKSVHVRLAIKHDQTGQYPPQNKISDYVVPTEETDTPAPVGAAPSQRKAMQADAESGVDIPF